MTWRPIATAPRDGTQILGYGDWAGEINGAEEGVPAMLTIHYLFKGRTDYPGYNWSVVGTDAYAAWMRPTHWQPLPAPPEDEG